MGFIREYSVIIGAIMIVSLMGYVWYERGKLCSASEVSSTEKTVQPIEAHETAIGNNPLGAPAMLVSLRRAKF